MEKIYAFTDEAGNNSFNFQATDVSSHFIVTCILVDELNVSSVTDSVEEVRKKYFQTGEMKSSSVGRNHNRRRKIINALNDIDYKVFSIVVDKRELDTNSGLRFKQSFYKFINNLVHKELRQSFTKLVICADEIGGNDYMASFIKYVKEHEEMPNLLSERDFYFMNSKDSVLVQLADFIGGTLLYVYDDNKDSDGTNYLSMLKSKIIRIENYPKHISDYTFNGGALSKEYDEDIANIALRRAQLFIEKNNGNEDSDVKNQLLVLKYLCFRFINNDTRDYISTRELLSYIKTATGKQLKVQYFRTKVIAKLRDENVVIASSPKGYKLPSKIDELYDFINHGTTIIMPMLDRLKKCRDVYKLDTLGRLDLFDNTEYTSLQQFFDKKENVE